MHLSQIGDGGAALEFLLAMAGISRETVISPPPQHRHFRMMRRNNECRGG
jgi:hypothetical protein